MLCKAPNCKLEAYGYDIERAWDEDDEPIYAVYFMCDNEHKFVAEYIRDDETEKV